MRGLLLLLALASLLLLLPRGRAAHTRRPMLLAASLLLKSPMRPDEGQMGATRANDSSPQEVTTAATLTEHGGFFAVHRPQ